MSWSGSEQQRKQDRGTCLPPKRAPNKTPKYLIPAETLCEVQNLATSVIRWRPYVTKRELAFERYETAVMMTNISLGNYVNVYEFREGGWLIRVRKNDVVRRDSLR